VCWQKKMFSGLVAWSHSLLVFFITYIHTFIHIHFIYYTRWVPLVSSSLFDQLRTSTGVSRRDSNSGPPYSSPTRYQLSHAVPYWATPHPTDSHRTLLIHAASYWSTPHPTNPRRTLLINSAPYWSTPHPIDSRRTLQYCKILGSQHFGKSHFLMLSFTCTSIYCQLFIQKSSKSKQADSILTSISCRL
jgi:hypothetical protein